MLDGYHNTFKSRLFRTMFDSIDIPDPELGIGDAEDTRGKPLVLHYPAKAPTVAVLYPAMDVQDASPKLQGAQVTLDYFPNSGWLGNPYGEV